jgi:phosphatidylserine/phosphatidylglycerophosphate/cardiolipin synthase-like enzyme
MVLKVKSLLLDVPPQWPALVAALGSAKFTVLVQAYSFTSAPIAKALVEAHRRGVKVEVVLDKSQRTEKYSSATFVYNNGIPCYIDAQLAIAHDKVMVIDGQTVITGSFNFTKAAEDIQPPEVHTRRQIRVDLRPGWPRPRSGRCHRSQGA